MALFALFVAVTVLYAFILYTKIAQSVAHKKQIMYFKKIKSDLERILETHYSLYESHYANYISMSRAKLEKKEYKKWMESILLEYLENPEHKHYHRVLSIAYDLDFPPQCLPLIQSRRNRRMAIGFRKAGLYKYEEALPYMREALKVFTGETQFQILMAISRIGDVDAMQQAFDDISKYVMLNERAAFQILSVFSGDKIELYRRMIHREEDYISAIFLKSLDADTATILLNDIVGVFSEAGKETRIAAIRAIKISEESIFLNQLLNALNDADWEVRAMAAKSLGALSSPQVGVSLSKSINDSEWWVRQNAAFSLLSYPNCEELFLEIIKSKDPYARDSIIYILQNTERLDILSAVQQTLAEMEEQEANEDGFMISTEMQKLRQ